MKTGADFKAAAEDHEIRRWNIRSCSLCGCPLHYLFKDGQVYFQGGCGCRWDPPQPRSWEDVAEHYGMQSAPTVIARYDEFWHFDATDCLTPPPAPARP